MVAALVEGLCMDTHVAVYNGCWFEPTRACEGFYTRYVLTRTIGGDVLDKVRRVHAVQMHGRSIYVEQIDVYIN